MKKLVSIILAVMLVLSLSATAFADGYNSNVKDRGFYDFDDNWWYDWYGTDGYDLYYFDEDELNEVQYTPDALPGSEREDRQSCVLYRSTESSRSDLELLFRNLYPHRSRQSHEYYA